jgi:hypothetical protein
MSVQRRQGARSDDQYYWLTAFLAAAGMRTAVSRTIAAIIVTLGAIPLILMLTPQGPRGLSSQLLAAGVAVGVGQSGLGRELGADGIRAFTQPRGYVRQPAPQ